MILLLLAPTLYVLSVGPYLVFRHNTTSTQGDAFYYPLDWLYNQSSFVKAFFDWYIPFWVDR